MIDDGRAVVDNRSPALASEGTHLYPSCRALRLQQRSEGEEANPCRSASGERWPSEGDFGGHPDRIQRDDSARRSAEQ